MISHIMLNLRMHSQRHNSMASGKLAKPMPGMRSSEVASSMGARSAGMTTIMASPVTPSAPYTHYPQQPHSMLTETLERFGAPMTGNGDELDGGYQEIIDLPAYSREAPRHSSGPVGPTRRPVSSIALSPLNQARTREIDFL